MQSSSGGSGGGGGMCGSRGNKTVAGIRLIVVRSKSWVTFKDILSVKDEFRAVCIQLVVLYI